MSEPTPVSGGLNRKTYGTKPTISEGWESVGKCCREAVRLYGLSSACIKCVTHLRAMAKMPSCLPITQRKHISKKTQKSWKRQ